MLRRVPGVNVLDEYGQGLRPNIGIGGWIPGAAKYSPDDGRYSHPAGSFGDASTYYMVPIERIDHIEVIRRRVRALFTEHAGRPD